MTYYIADILNQFVFNNPCTPHRSRMALKLSANDVNDIDGAECTVQLFETGESGVKLRGKKSMFT